MPVSHGPYHDPEEENPPRRRKAPKALARLKREYNYERRLAAFVEVYQRQPSSDEELEAFFDEYIREIYNSGLDEV